MVNNFLSGAISSTISNEDLSQAEIERREKLRKKARRAAREYNSNHRAKLEHAQGVAGEGFVAYAEPGACSWTESDGLTLAAEQAEKAHIDGIVVTHVTDNSELDDLVLVPRAKQTITVRLFGKRVSWLQMTPLLSGQDGCFEIAGWRVSVPGTSARPAIELSELDSLTPASLLGPESWNAVCEYTLEQCQGDEPDWLMLELSIDDAYATVEVRANAIDEVNVHYEILLEDEAQPVLDRTMADVVMCQGLMPTIESRVISDCAHLGLAVDPSGMW